MSTTDSAVDPKVCNAPLTARYPELAGRVAVVTGAAGGIGRAFVQGMAAQGIHVVAADLNGDALADLETSGNVEEGTGQITARSIDVSTTAANEDLVSTAISRHGRLDFFIGAAAMYPHSAAIDIPEAQMRTALQVNVEGLLYGAQAAAKVMQPGSAIVTLSSVNAVRARRDRATYSITKAAVAHMTRALAIEFADKGIRVNSIAPGFIDTAMTRWVQDDPIALAAALDKLPLHRVGSPTEVLGGLLFLLSDSARYVTGHSLAIDGGSQLT